MTKIEIDAERIKLRLIEETDLESIHAILSLPETDSYNALRVPQSIDDTRAIITTLIAEHDSATIEKHTFAIRDRTSGEFIGLCALNLGSAKYKSAEVWYKLHTDYWNRGYATEALTAMIAFGFRGLGLHRITAGCAVENIASYRVMEKAGMIREGIGRQVLPLKSGWSDCFEYSILESDDRST